MLTAWSNFIMPKENKTPAIFFLIFLMLAFVSPTAQAGEKPSYLEDQAIDQLLGLFKLPWTMNLPRVSSRLDQPPQVQSGGLPPYGQEVERAQSFGAPETSQRICYNGQGQQIPC